MAHAVQHVQGEGLIAHALNHGFELADESLAVGGKHVSIGGFDAADGGDLAAIVRFLADNVSGHVQALALDIGHFLDLGRSEQIVLGSVVDGFGELLLDSHGYTFLRCKAAPAL